MNKYIFITLDKFFRSMLSKQRYKFIGIDKVPRIYDTNEYVPRIHQ